MDISFTTIHCCECHIIFAITTDLYNRLCACHNTLYCPQGHAQHFADESNAEREKRLRLVAQAERDALAVELAKFKSRRKVSAKPVKAKKAAKNGKS